MTPAEFKTLRESLGLTTAWLADRFNVSERSVQRWDNGDSPVPDAIAGELLDIEDCAEERADDALEQLRAHDGAEIEYQVPRVDEDVPNASFPASFYRAVAARVRAGNADVRLVYLSEPDQGGDGWITSLDSGAAGM